MDTNELQPSANLTLAEFERKTRDELNSLVNPNVLRMVSQSSGGFTFQMDPNLKGTGRNGYTNIATRVIYYSPDLFVGNPHYSESEEHRRERIRGFFWHEPGHHAPDVILLQDKMLEDVSSLEIPEYLKDAPESTKTRFLKAVYQNVANGASDIWLEAYLGRVPYFLIRRDFENRHKSDLFQDSPESLSQTRRHFASFPRHRQLIQAVLTYRYNKQYDFSKVLNEDVYKEFQGIVKGPQGKSSALDVLMDTRAFTGFPSPAEKEKAINDKFLVYKYHLLPAFLRLLKIQAETEADELKVDFSEEDLEELIQQIIEAMEAANNNHTEAPSSDDDENANKLSININIAAKKEKPSSAEPEKDVDDDPTGAKALEKAAKKLKDSQDERRMAKMAEEKGVSAESIAKWGKIKEKYYREIENLAAGFAEIFLHDRRAKRDFLYREGMMVEGLEYETVAAILSGDIDPQTNFKMVTNPDFLEVEMEFILDTSGSMQGSQLDASLAMIVIASEALKRVKDILKGEGLLRPAEEEPFRVGVTGYSDSPFRVTELSEPLGDDKEIKIIYGSTLGGGGTDEVAAVAETYEKMSLNKKNIIKIITLLTDGEGNKAGIKPIMRQIEDDDEVAFLVLALGSSSSEIVESYILPLSNREGGNVKAITAVTPEQIIDESLEFLGKEVSKRKA